MPLKENVTVKPDCINILCPEDFPKSDSLQKISLFKKKNEWAVTIQTIRYQKFINTF